MPTTVLRTTGLTKRYGDLIAVRDLDLEVHEGEVFGFLGPNGAGKTTAIHMMCGLLEPDAGTVTIRGVPVTEADADARARVGVCPQEIVLWERLTCIEQLRFIGQMYGLTGAQARRNGDRLLEQLDLSAKRDEQARNLSGGMKRRLNMAMALVHDPEIVVLDEPEAGLDPQSRIKVREYIQSLASHKTVIVTTHNMDEADRVADRVAIIDHGVLLVLDTPDALKHSLGEGAVVELRLIGLDGNGQAVLEAMRGRFDHAALDEDRAMLTVRAPDAMNALPGILSMLGEFGASADRLRVREPTLEDVFIQLTGRSLRE